MERNIISANRSRGAQKAVKRHGVNILTPPKKESLETIHRKI